jgi:hypothetical protein
MIVGNRFSNHDDGGGAAGNKSDTLFHMSLVRTMLKEMHIPKKMTCSGPQYVDLTVLKSMIA